MIRLFRVVLAFLIAAALGQLLPTKPSALAQTATVTADRGASQRRGVLHSPGFDVPRKTLSMINPHDKKTEVDEGVPLETLLQRAGIPQGELLCGSKLTTYVIVEAEDYRVVFSLAELDSGIYDSEIIVADTMGGAPLAVKVGPFRLVAPHEKRSARWVRMLKTITIVRRRSLDIRSRA